MKGDTLKSYPERKSNTDNYTGVLHQQGRVLLDQDWNDQTYITTTWQDQAGRDLFGAGVAAIPATEFQNFKIQIDTISIDEESNKISFLVTPGRLWADGLLLYLEYRECVKPKRIALKHPLFKHSDNDDNEEEEYAILLEVWRETVNGFQIPNDLIEPALGGVDTTLRLQTAFAFRVLKLPSESNDTCVDIRDRINYILTAKKGRLTVIFDSTGGDNEKHVEEWSGYTGLEHRNYRIEVAETNEGPPYKMFKWSRCNGGLVGRGMKNGDTIKITANLQAILSSGSKKFYLEYIRYNKKYGFWESAYGAIVQLNPENDLEVNGAPYLTKEAIEEDLFFRLWDGILPVKDDMISLEDGIYLQFDTTNWRNMRPGDYWTFQARPARSRAKLLAKSVQVLKCKEPDGINYHLVPFALISRNKDGTFDLTDCRKPFRSLVNQKDCRIFKSGKHGQFTNILDALETLSRHTLAFLEEMVKELEVEKMRFEKETRERLEAEVQEKMRAKRLEIEEEVRKKTEAERKNQ